MEDTRVKVAKNIIGPNRYMGDGQAC